MNENNQFIAWQNSSLNTAFPVQLAILNKTNNAIARSADALHELHQQVIGLIRNAVSQGSNIGFRIEHYGFSQAVSQRKQPKEQRYIRRNITGRVKPPLCQERSPLLLQW